jgi:hypothetical protein
LRGKNYGLTGKHAIYGAIGRAAKDSRWDVQVGFHIWHANSLSPFVRAEQDYAAVAKVVDFLKIVLHNNCGGPRYVRHLEQRRRDDFSGCAEGRAAAAAQSLAELWR